ncbi:hypothetical protein [Candidatus Poriferisodalis sp.]|uniref:hypothetical protein n=1 Tax=Candidatus Poriferisodalis sp. TaxID=3101277 RepID=UPI003B011033
MGHRGGSITASYWDSDESQATGPGGEGKTTAELQTPTDYTGIYANWNVDLDGDGSADDPWDFGTSCQYPVLKYGGPQPRRPELAVRARHGEGGGCAGGGCPGGGCPGGGCPGGGGDRPGGPAGRRDRTEPYNVQVTPGDGTLTVTWTVAPREGLEDDAIRHALRWSQQSRRLGQPAGAVGRC